MDKILLSAFDCDPSKGSEPGYGWNWASGLAKKGFEVHCLTRVTGKAEIEKQHIPENLHFHYLTLPFGLEGLFELSVPGQYAYYMTWQWLAYRKAKVLNRRFNFRLAHHATWGSAQMGSHMYKLGIPFIFGPVGGGQAAPAAFKKYFLDHWAAEGKRAKISSLLLRFNPACKNMCRKAQTILVSNPDTYEMLKSIGAKNIEYSLDASLPEGFYPVQKIIKKTTGGKLNLLWTGSIRPRKGTLLLLDVMKELKEYKDIVLTVVGDGEMREEFLEKLKNDQLQDSVIWKGQVPYNEIKKYYENNDVFFMTSLRDSGPSQLIEAMAYGMPVVTLDLHGQGFIVNDQTGIRCNTETPEIAIQDLKNAILKLAFDPALVAQMSVAAFEFASHQNWGEKIDTVITKYYSLS